jgi:two-component system, sensor histidine kinase PdtaS
MMKSDTEYHADPIIENRQLKEMLSDVQSQLEKKIDAENRLKVTLEELHIHQEELRTQNEDLIQAKEVIETTHRKYQDLYDFAPVGFFDFDRNGLILEANLTGAEILGKYRNDLLGKPFRLYISKESKNTFFRHLREVLNGNSASDTIWLNVQHRPDFPAEIISMPFSSSTEPCQSCRTAIKDISDRHQAESNLKAALQEKEVLLQEIHHRVKNNMQVIRSLLSLQSANIREQKLKAFFRESCSRIDAMARIHEMLYKSDSLSEINLRDYVEGLASGLMGTHNISTNRIAIRVDCARIFLGIDQAIPCALIINELISNSLKHAFAQGAGKIHIEAVSDARDGIILTVSDTGRGMPEDFDIRKTNSLGLKLVWGLVERQLGGRIELHRDKGTRFKIRFPRDAASEVKVVKP